MQSIDSALSSLEPRHRQALRWFNERAGQLHKWPEPMEDGTLLASKAKGIYKPNWMQYALSIRQTLGGPYADREPVHREDGTWCYAYFQENEDPNQRDQEYTNKGLLACLADQVPVGVMRQVTGKPRVRYEVLGLAFVANWEAGYFFLEGATHGGVAHEPGPDAEIEVISQSAERQFQRADDFAPSNILDGRQRVLASIVRRRGQPAFRRILLDLYEGRCAMTSCDVVPALEAAHIVPYQGLQTNHPSNGLLLRSDVHVLFDIGRISVNAHDMTIVLAPELRTTMYGQLEGMSLRLPRQNAPSTDALAQHRVWARI